jgi:hypothetical protein
MSTDDLAALAANLQGKTTPSRTAPPAKTADKPAPPAKPAAPLAPADEKADADGADNPVDETAPVEVEQSQGADVEVKKPRKAVARKPAASSSSASGAPNLGAGLAAMPSAGDLLQVRTQPPSTGEWMNRLMDTGQYALDCRRGDIMGAVLVIAMLNSDDVVALLEAWRGIPTDPIKAMVWELWKNSEEKRKEEVVQVVDQE